MSSKYIAIVFLQRESGGFIVPGIFFHDIETWACLVDIRKVTMSAYQCFRKGGVKFGDEFVQRFALGGVSSVGGRTVGTETANITYTHTILIVAFDVRTGNVAFSPEFDSAVSRYHIVITDVRKATFYHVKQSNLGGS